MPSPTTPPSSRSIAAMRPASARVLSVARLATMSAASPAMRTRPRLASTASFSARIADAVATPIAPVTTSWYGPAIRPSTLARTAALPSTSAAIATLGVPSSDKVIGRAGPPTRLSTSAAPASSAAVSVRPGALSVRCSAPTWPVRICPSTPARLARMSARLSWMVKWAKRASSAAPAAWDALINCDRITFGASRASASAPLSNCAGVSAMIPDSPPDSSARNPMVASRPPTAAACNDGSQAAMFSALSSTAVVCGRRISRPGMELAGMTCAPLAVRSMPATMPARLAAEIGPAKSTLTGEPISWITLLSAAT